MMTDEVIEAFAEIRLTNERVSFVRDDILVYRLTPAGAVIGEAVSGYHGITTGVPTRVKADHTLRGRDEEE